MNKRIISPLSLGERECSRALSSLVLHCWRRHCQAVSSSSMRSERLGVIPKLACILAVSRLVLMVLAWDGGAGTEAFRAWWVCQAGRPEILPVDTPVPLLTAR